MKYAFNQNRNVLVTGASGRIGYLLTNELVTQGFRVYAKTTRRERFFKNNEKSLTLLDYKEFPKHINFDTIFLTAGVTDAYKHELNPKEVLRHEVKTSIEVIRETIKHQSHKPRIIYLSSSTVYGCNPILPITETTKVNPESYYDINKIIIEQQISEMFQDNLIQDLFILRLANIYGINHQTNENRGFLDKSIEKCVNNQKGLLFDGGNFLRDFLHIEDLLQLLVLLTKVNCRSKLVLWNVGSGSSVSLLDAYRLIDEISTNKFHTKFIWDEADFPHGSLAIERRNYSFSMSKLMTEIQWSPKISLEQGILSGMEQLHKMRELE